MIVPFGTFLSCRTPRRKSLITEKKITDIAVAGSRNDCLFYNKLATTLAYISSNYTFIYTLKHIFHWS